MAAAVGSSDETHPQGPARLGCMNTGIGLCTYIVTHRHTYCTFLKLIHICTWWCMKINEDMRGPSGVAWERYIDIGAQVRNTQTHTHTHIYIYTHRRRHTHTEILVKGHTFSYMQAIPRLQDKSWKDYQGTEPQVRDGLLDGIQLTVHP